MRCPILERRLPKLADAGYQKTSDQTGLPPIPGAYNCIAWAAHDIHRWWWPSDDTFWPFWIERKSTVDCFVKTFRWLGYRVCTTSRQEFGYEKIVLYTRGVEPKHMARQLSNGTWTSKCGDLEDITHFTLDAVELDDRTHIRVMYLDYGHPAVYMKRLIIVAWLIRMIQWIEWRVYSSWK